MEFATYIDKNRCRSGKPRTYVLAIENGHIHKKIYATQENLSIDKVVEFVNNCLKPVKQVYRRDTIADYLL